MDPLRELCKITNKRKTWNIPMYSEEIRSPRGRKNILVGEDKTHFSIIDKKLPIDIALPQVESSFKHRTSLILANIDTIFNFSLQEDGYILPQRIDPDFKYAILGTDSGFLQYMRYRLPASTGFINCTNELANNDEIANNDQIENNNSNNKQFLNINCELDKLSDYVLGIVPEGLDLVLSNKILDTNILNEALKICKIDGTFIGKFDNNVNINLLYSIADNFNEFYLFKPFLSDLNENTSFFIAKEFRGYLIKEQKVSLSFNNFVKNYYLSFNNLKNELFMPANKLNSANKLAPANKLVYNMYKCKALMNVF